MEALNRGLNSRFMLHPLRYRVSGLPDVVLETEAYGFGQCLNCQTAWRDGLSPTPAPAIMWPQNGWLNCDVVSVWQYWD